MIRTYYIFPINELHGLRRLLFCDSWDKTDPLKHWKAYPKVWHSVGWIDADGYLHSFDGCREDYEALLKILPMVPGATIRMEIK